MQEPRTYTEVAASDLALTVAAHDCHPVQTPAYIPKMAVKIPGLRVQRILITWLLCDVVLLMVCTHLSDMCH